MISIRATWYRGQLASQMSIFERGSCTVFTFSILASLVPRTFSLAWGRGPAQAREKALGTRLQLGSLSEIGKTTGKSGKQWITNLWPDHFVEDKIYETKSKEYSTLMMPMIAKYGRGKATAWHSVCFLQMTCCHVFSVYVLYPVCNLHFVLSDWGSMW